MHERYRLMRRIGERREGVKEKSGNGVVIVRESEAGGEIGSGAEGGDGARMAGQM
jgi:hypothetical protein